MSYGLKIMAPGLGSHYQLIFSWYNKSQEAQNDLLIARAFVSKPDYRFYPFQQMLINV